MVLGVSLSPALGRWFRHAIPFAIFTLLLLYISVWLFHEWPFELPAQRTQQSGLWELKLSSPSPALTSLLPVTSGFTRLQAWGAVLQSRESATFPDWPSIETPSGPREGRTSLSEASWVAGSHGEPFPGLYEP